MEAPRSSVRLILISGCSGVGKSTITYEVCHKLRQQQFAHIHIEADNLDAAYPRPDGIELMLANLRVMWRNFYAMSKGEHALILSGTAMVLNYAEIRRVIEEVSECDAVVTGIILTASRESIDTRLKQREIGTDLESHRRSSEKMAQQLADFNTIPIVRVVTDDKDVPTVAEFIMQRIILKDI